MLDLGRVCESARVKLNGRDVATVWSRPFQVRVGEFHMTWGAPAGAINDPSDYWGQWFKTNGPQNYAKWSNPKFDDLLAKIDD